MNDKVDNFPYAIETVLKHEGGFVNDPDDLGGVTNFGISIRYLKKRGDADLDGILDGDLDNDGDIDYHDVRNMTRSQAINLYELIWNRSKAYLIRNREVSTKFFDLCVNMGNKQATSLLQRAIIANGIILVDDGIFGPITERAISQCSPTSLLSSLRSEAASFYRILVIKKPIFSKYENGWLNRAYS